MLNLLTIKPLLIKGIIRKKCANYAQNILFKAFYLNAIRPGFVSMYVWRATKGAQSKAAAQQKKRTNARAKKSFNYLAISNRKA